MPFVMPEVLGGEWKEFVPRRDDLNPQERKIYLKAVEKSGGYNVPRIPNIMNRELIHPIHDLTRFRRIPESATQKLLRRCMTDLKVIQFIYHLFILFFFLKLLIYVY